VRSAASSTSEGVDAESAAVRAPAGIRRALIVTADADPATRELCRSLHLALDRHGVEVAAVSGLDAGIRWLATARCDLAFAAAPIAGELVAATRGGLAVIALCPDVATAIAAIDGGAADGLVGVITDAELVLALRRAASRRGDAGSGAAAPAPIAVAVPPASPVTAGERLIGDSAAMHELRTTIGRIAGHRTTVLVTGESGTGKELVARALHDASPRAKHRFVAINCAAIPGPLLESELFGHKRGAFTDAVRDKPGLFEDADGGTLFLDEVGELPFGLQAKLLRALQESEIRRVGDTASIKIDVRLIAATLRDLAAEARAGRFREDLYYRLAVLPIAVPPLRDRPDDVPRLVEHFVGGFEQRHGRAARFTPDAIELLQSQPWPGNVRELENAVERALVLAEGPTVDAAQLAGLLGARSAARPGTAPGEPAAAGTAEPSAAELSIKKATRGLEADLIRRALEATGGNRTNAARLLEISHRALLYKLKEYGIS
jgi:two-component system, NtrC family, response regulator AtoC